ncbi:MAG: hypothetical protein LUI87_05310 [Lachnospiraceae bacterium]|nr:hypothetical protein [Lachnospiraceae bacterium]
MVYYYSNKKDGIQTAFLMNLKDVFPTLRYSGACRAGLTHYDKIPDSDSRGLAAGSGTEDEYE